MTDDEFFRFCQMNDNLAFERNADGQIIVMPPTTSTTGISNATVNGELYIWNRINNLGYLFDSSTGFKLPNGATRSPDVAWVAKARWEALSVAEQESFAPLCPDFVVEIRSKTDDLKSLQQKMDEYMANGCRLGWLLDLKNQHVYVYRIGEGFQKIDNLSETLSGENVLSGFSLELKRLL